MTVGHGGSPEPAHQLRAGRGRETLVDRERCIAVVPHSAECVDEASATGEVDRDEPIHSGEAGVMP